MMPKPLMPVSLLPSARAMPTPSASTRGAVTVPVVMPPVSHATPTRSRAVGSSAATIVRPTASSSPGMMVNFSDHFLRNRTIPLTAPSPTPAAASHSSIVVRSFRKS